MTLIDVLSYLLNKGLPTKLMAARMGSGIGKALGSKMYLPSSVRQTPSNNFMSDNEIDTVRLISMLKTLSLCTNI